MQLFSTINAKGKPLSKASLLKTELCKHAAKLEGQAASVAVAKQWAKRCEICNSVFEKRTKAQSSRLDPIEFAFYLYAQNFQANLKWQHFDHPYWKNHSKLLLDPKTIDDIDALLKFFLALTGDKKGGDMSSRAVRAFYILSKLSKTVHFQMATAFFLRNRDVKGRIDVPELEAFLERLIAVIVGHYVNFASAHFTVLGTIVSECEDFIFNADSGHCNKFSRSAIEENLNNFCDLKNMTRLRKPLLFWWTFQNPNQPLPKTWWATFEFEHILAKAIASRRSLAKENSFDLLGNLALLEKNINSKAGALPFSEKIKVYKAAPTFNQEILALAETHSDFTESDILKRNQQILTAVLDMLKAHNLLTD